jgi:hypothetical protein
MIAGLVDVETMRDRALEATDRGAPTDDIRGTAAFPGEPSYDDLARYCEE